MTIQEYARLEETRRQESARKLLERMMPQPAPRVTARWALQKLADGFREYLGPAVRKVMDEATQQWADAMLFGTSVTHVDRKGKRTRVDPRDLRFAGIARRWRRKYHVKWGPDTRTLCYPWQPFSRWRWKAPKGETYGVSPVVAALGDIKAIQALRPEKYPTAEEFEKMTRQQIADHFRIPASYLQSDARVGDLRREKAVIAERVRYSKEWDDIRLKAAHLAANPPFFPTLEQQAEADRKLRKDLERMRDRPSRELVE